MYFLNRYFADVPDKTDLDLEIASILDENAAGREFLLTVLESYQEMGEDEKYESFYFEMVEMTAHGHFQRLPLGPLVEDRYVLLLREVLPLQHVDAQGAVPGA